MLRFDQLFSYWIFVWYLIYQAGLVNYNPKFALIVAIIENIIQLTFMVMYNNSLKYILIFIGVNTVIKLIPIWTIWKTQISKKDIYLTGILYIIYLIWMHATGMPISEFLDKCFIAIKTNKPITPMMRMLN